MLAHPAKVETAVAPRLSPQARGPLSGLRRALIWLIAFVDSAVMILVIFVLPLPAQTPPVFAIANVVPVVSFGIVGALLATRRPNNPIGWLFWAAGLVWAAGLLSALAAYGTAVGGGALAGWPSVPAAWLAWLSNDAFALALFATVLFVPLLFPDGRLPSRRWRLTARLMVVWLAIVMLLATFGPGPYASPGFSHLDNPIGIAALAPYDEAVGGVAALLAPACLAATVFAPIWRYRHGGVVERQQLKWFALATAVTVGAILGVVALTSSYPDLAVAAEVVGLTSFAFIPVAITIAILRYRLYDVDLLINRTLVYGALTATLAAAYLGAIALFQVALRPLTQESQPAVAASTLVVAAMFQPLRAAFQRTVDRRFYRTRYDAATTLETFGARLRSEFDLAALGAAVVDAALDTVQPRQAWLWLRGGLPSRSPNERTQRARS